MQKHAKRLEELKSKKIALQEKEDKIKAEILSNLSETLIRAQAIDIDFYTLVGGILDIVEKTKHGSPEMEVWKQAGQKFCKAHAKKKTAKNPSSSTKIKKDKNASK